MNIYIVIRFSPCKGLNDPTDWLYIVHRRTHLFHFHRDLIIPNEERQTKVDLLLDAYGLLARRDLYRAALTMTHTAIWFLRSLSIIGGQVI